MHSSNLYALSVLIQTRSLSLFVALNANELRLAGRERSASTFMSDSEFDPEQKDSPAELQTPRMQQDISEWLMIAQFVHGGQLMCVLESKTVHNSSSSSNDNEGKIPPSHCGGEESSEVERTSQVLKHIG